MTVKELRELLEKYENDFEMGDCIVYFRAENDIDEIVEGVIDSDTRGRAIALG